MKGFWRWFAEGIISFPFEFIRWFNGYSRAEREIGSGVFLAVAFSAVGIALIGLYAFIPFSLGILLIFHGIYLKDVKSNETEK